MIQSQIFSRIIKSNLLPEQNLKKCVDMDFSARMTKIYQNVKLCQRFRCVVGPNYTNKNRC